MRIDDLELSVRTHNTLIRAGVNTIEILDNMSDEQLLKIKNFNSKCLVDVKEKLRKFRETRHE